MKKIKRLNDKGYTLVEMIIVIAIIVVLSGAAFITLSVLHTAKVRDAASTFYAEVNALHAKSVSQKAYIDANDNGKLDPGELSDTCRFSLNLYKKGEKTYAQRVVRDSGIISTANLGNNNGGLGFNLSSYCRIKYTSADGSVVKDDMSDTIQHYITFDSTGACIEGVGTYDFYKRNGGKLVTVTINSNGSYQIK